MRMDLLDTETSLQDGECLQTSPILACGRLQPSFSALWLIVVWSQQAKPAGSPKEAGD
jgi:hypothetical protein